MVDSSTDSGTSAGAPQRKNGLRVVSLDADPLNADWTKQSWDLPPYKSAKFMALFEDLDSFRLLPVYQHAVAKGLIVNDEWAGAAASGVSRTADGPATSDGDKSPPPYWQILSKGIDELGRTATTAQLKAYVLKERPNANPAVVNAQITIATVNNRSRVHYTQNAKPRVCDGYLDILFSTGKGSFERYDAARHGLWAIESEGADLVVKRIQDPIEEEPDADSEPLTVVGSEAAASTTFAIEAHLRDYLAKGLPVIDNHKLSLFSGPGGQGIEYPTDVGPIDLLTRAPNGDFYVFELKRHGTEDKTLGQVLRYMGWVRKHLAGPQKVIGVIVGSQTSQKLKYAACTVPDVRLCEYRLNFTLQLASPLD